MLLLLTGCMATWSILGQPGTESSAPGADLDTPIVAGQVRAGVVTDPSQLFGGISAEGRVGDVKLENAQARFVLQQVGDSSYYVEYGGQLVDADVQRADGEPGRDMIDELGPMIGLGRVVEATSVTVLEDGSDGRAVVRVEGEAMPMRLITGALESTEVVPELAVHVVTDYTLLPDQPSVEVATVIVNDDSEDFSGNLGLFGIYAQEVATAWRPGEGRDPEGIDDTPWTGLLAEHNEGALAIVGDGQDLVQGQISAMIGSMAAGITGFSPPLTVAPGESATWKAKIAVGRDLAELSGDALLDRGDTGQYLHGTVTAGGSPVPGARVQVLDGDGAPVTVAIADSSGDWSAVVPTGPYQLQATGRGPGRFLDLGDGHAWISPYDARSDEALATLEAGAPTEPMAEGYGVGTPGTSTNLELSMPGKVRVTVADGGPAVVHLYFPDGDPVAADERVVPGRPDGAEAVGWVRDGQLDLDVEPGDYTLVANRGVRDEVDVQNLHVDAGVTTEVTVDIVAAYTLDDGVVGDPHCHAAPSGDGGVPMEDRILTVAANGIDVHFGTDHDHIADYRPIIPAEGLSDRLVSVVADEDSPVLRGHFNMYPATPDDSANHGAPRWWFGYTSTQDIFDAMRSNVGDDGIIQANHPVGSSGMFTYADYDTTSGTIGAPDHWSDDFQAMEVVNSGDWEDYLPYFLDLAARGRDVAPVGVSDSHSWSAGGIGMNVTFLHTGGPLADFGDDVLRSTIRARHTVASKGPYLHATVGGAWAPGETFVGPTTLDVEVKAPSWMPVNELTLYENGVAVSTVTCTGAAPTPCSTSFSLSPGADADYVVVAEGTSPMEYAHIGDYAFAATADIRLDVDGDGWAAPLPDLVQ